MIDFRRGALGLGAWTLGYTTGVDGPWWFLLLGCLLIFWATNPRRDRVTEHGVHR